MTWIKSLSVVSLKKKALFLLALLWLTTALSAVKGQQRTPDPPSAPAMSTTQSPAPADPQAAVDDQYRIKPGDVLEIRVFDRPQLSREAVRVDANGMIRMPLIKGEIQAACRTEAELAQAVTKQYLEYQTDPQVDVFIKEYHPLPVSVIGAVAKAGRFELQRRVRLLELLALAGGPSENAGPTVQIIHDQQTSLCEKLKGAASKDPDDGAIVSLSLGDTLKGTDLANPYVLPGDIIHVPEAAQLFVVGNVYKPSTIPLKGRVTISQAIASAGGMLPDTRNEQIRVLRTVPGVAGKKVLLVNMKAINKSQAEDLVLQAGDIVDVPTASGRRFLRSVAAAFAPIIAYLPLYVIR